MSFLEKLEAIPADFVELFRELKADVESLKTRVEDVESKVGVADSAVAEDVKKLVQDASNAFKGKQ